ncbi:MAG: hypothetical protein J6B95_03430 [Oscillospiraceae bacterium]|nr:hypothetical protein [Oscillospiraceae bacterium]
MYNRYIPQSDGSFRRNSVQDHKSSPPNRQPPVHQTPEHREPEQRRKPVPQPQPISFLKNLLPRDFDTGDLMVVLLLLLMAGDCAKEQNTAILTLALYLFL